MSEGFFDPEALRIPQLSADTLRGAMVRILPRTILVLDIAPSADAARQRARNESMPDGSERWHRFFTPEDLAKVHEPEFAMGMVRHEFARAVRSNATFPVIVPLDGGGSGFAIDASGHVLTNYHLVTAEVAHHEREQGVIDSAVRCRSLRAQLAHPTGAGQWEWRDADALWLVSNPPERRAIVSADDGSARLAEDTALLRVEPCPTQHLNGSEQPVRVGDAVWMAGFPLRSARSARAREALGYADADGSLRVSTGRVLAIDGEGCFTSDIDGSMGNSGSPVFDADGRVVGMFSRATGNGPRNAFEYGHMNRVHVGIDLAKRMLRAAPSR